MFLIRRLGTSLGNFGRCQVRTATTIPKDTENAVKDGLQEVENDPINTAAIEETGEDGTQKVKLPYNEYTMKTLKLDQYPYYVEREWWKHGNRMTFWATWRMKRDVLRRESLAEYGPERMRLKALKYNTILPQALRDECSERLTHGVPQYSHPSLILNMCQFTGRRRGKIKPFRVNRHIFRRLADHSQLCGVKRAMW
ncbi:unnamed protein product [Bursaphelenchus okinawaensis]|uniref:Ribosomal protein S14 n=1 Tax=Bursaphelenchus okinawaensis TaxID=465554 RepID=A0A811LMN8_9BILA|nr:unnamed protein product [Bursaphelenchus okinawaensis]CAG9125275.1 unnamed protein product [Bursaphelenchus okinawaensis]